MEFKPEQEQEQESNLKTQELINQITLNCLLSKDQLHKLNKHKIQQKQKLIDARRSEIEKHSNELETLFKQLIEGNIPEHLPTSIIDAHENFVDKCIFYFNVTEKEMNDVKLANNEKNIKNVKKNKNKYKFRDEDQLFYDFDEGEDDFDEGEDNEDEDEEDEDDDELM